MKARLAFGNTQFKEIIHARSGGRSMLTYELNTCGKPLYQALYEAVRADIQAGRLGAGEKLPSKRALADHLGLSTITVENAYDQLVGEGYIEARPRRGYFVANVPHPQAVAAAAAPDLHIQLPDRPRPLAFDFSASPVRSQDFPFSVWARLMREMLSSREQDLLTVSPCGGVAELREAIAGHLRSFRGMNVDPDQIIVGAGTETLYGLLIQLLGPQTVYCIENPGYTKLRSIYESRGLACTLAGLDDQGMKPRDLAASGANVAHISPNHHFPTGITMPVSRRYELLAWANQAPDRLIIEDDYDSEFRLIGKPVPPLQSIDACGRVIYMNTFSKSLAPTIRISYMVLPQVLANRFYATLAFYSCTVSTFEQYTLAAFISRGYFEKHINRMRLRCGRRRARVEEAVREVFAPQTCSIIDNGSGLHLLLHLQTQKTDAGLSTDLARRGIGLQPVSAYDMQAQPPDRHDFIVNAAGLDLDRLRPALEAVRQEIE
jgi:GntR family transcriptional regulator/MocR family aminotransferase